MRNVQDLRITNNCFTHILSMALPALHLYMPKINTTFSLSTNFSNCYTNTSLTLSNHIATSQLEVLHIHHFSQAAFGTDSILLLHPNTSVLSPLSAPQCHLLYSLVKIYLTPFLSTCTHLILPAYLYITLISPVAMAL